MDVNTPNRHSTLKLETAFIQNADAEKNGFAACPSANNKEEAAKANQYRIDK